MGVACCPDAAIGITDYCTDAATVGLQVNEFRLNRPSFVSGFLSKVKQALVYFNVILAFDVCGFEFVHGFVV